MISDNLVLEAAGGEDAVKAMKESDEKGYREAEVSLVQDFGVWLLFEVGVLALVVGCYTQFGMLLLL